MIKTDSIEAMTSFALFAQQLTFNLQGLFKEYVPEYIDIVPFKNGWVFHYYKDEDWFCFSIEDMPGLQNNIINKLPESKIEYLKQKINPFEDRDFLQLYTLLGNEWYAYDKFTYIGNKNVFFSNNVSKLELTYSQLNVWLNHILLPELDRREQERVMRVLPPSISFNINDISEAVWILECEETFKQGTAFMLESYGLITCEHVLGTNTHAFQANNHNKKYPVRVVAKHEVIDIAILEIDAPSTVFLKKGSTENLKQLDPIAVFGFPNYNWGDTGNILSGHISGFKMVSAIRRILVNTPLIQGNSGSPIINNKNEVIGIAVTGADRMENAQNTENHGVIPIDALDLIIQKK